MRGRVCAVVLIVVAVSGAVGCDSGKVKPHDIQVTEIDPMVQFKNMLDNYVKGQPVTSEASQVEMVIGKIKLKDPAKGEIAEKGWEEIPKNKNNPSAKAKELLAKLK